MARDGASLGGQPRKIGQVKHACRVFETLGMAHPDELLNQPRIGEAFVGHNHTLLLLLRERGELRPKLLWSDIGYFPFGKKRMESLFRGGEGPAVIVTRRCFRYATLSPIEREAKEAFQPFMAQAHVQ